MAWRGRRSAEGYDGFDRFDPYGEDDGFMTGPALITAPRRRRLVDYPRRGKAGVRRWLPSWKLVLASFFSFVLLMTGSAFAVYAAIPIPSLKTSSQAQHLTVLDMNGKVIGYRGPEIRQDVPLSKVPVPVQDAVLAAEDRSYWTEGAISITGTARAALNNLTGGSTQGGSTITQQYVKNAYLTNQQTLDRKVREAVISLKVSREMSKQQVLEGYLNTVYFGRGTSGIEMASRAWFGKDVDQLSVAEGAVLASVVNAPAYYENASKDPQVLAKLTARWNYVLDGMVTMGKLTPAQRAAEKFPALAQWPKANTGEDSQYPYLVEAAIAEAQQKLGVDRQTLLTGGYTITTTFDTQMQDAAAATVKSQILDKLQPNTREADKYVRTSIATVVPGDGAVRVLYGGYDDYTKNAFNASWQGAIQPGSTFKAFVLAAYLQNGGQLSDTFNGNSPVTGTYGGQPYTIPNEGGVNYGNVDVWHAAQSSVNTAFVQMALKAGVPNVVSAAHAAGIPSTTNIPDVATTALGVVATSPMQMAGAYATFAAHGQQSTPYTVSKVTQDGNTVYTAPKTGKTAFSANVADQVTSVLKSVVTDGSGGAAQLNDGRDVAGKTGTTDLPGTNGNRASAWFVGYTPQLSTAVAIWGEKPDGSLVSANGMLGQNLGGGAVAAPLWAAYMNQAVAGTPAVAFTNVTSDVVATIPPPTTPSSTAAPSVPSPTSSATTPPPPTKPTPSSSSSTPITPPTTTPSRTPPTTPSGTPSSSSTPSLPSTRQSSPVGASTP
jgi:membrane peptidoglycan carboxypeptidase